MAYNYPEEGGSADLLSATGGQLPPLPSAESSAEEYLTFAERAQRINNDVIDAIRTRGPIRAFTYWVDPVVTAGALTIPMTAECTTRSSTEIVDAWRGPVSGIVPVRLDLFRETLNYDITSFQDLAAFNGRLLPVMRLFLDDMFDPKARTRVFKDFCTNLSQVNRALHEITALIRDAADEREAIAAELRELETRMAALVATRGVRFGQPSPFAGARPQLTAIGITPEHEAFLLAAIPAGPGGALTQSRLVYQGTRHGLRVSDFHRHVDGVRRVLVLIREEEHGWLFGGFTDVGFGSPPVPTNVHDPQAFVFTLTNPHGIPPTKYASAGYNSIYHGSAYGVDFIGGVYQHDDRTWFCYLGLAGLNTPRGHYIDTTGRGYETFTGAHTGWTVSEVLVIAV